MSAGREAQARDAIDRALARVAPGRTICPSDAARLAAGDEGFRDWMDDVRAAADAMVAEGVLEVTQGGEVVDRRAARGPIRLRRASSR